MADLPCENCGRPDREKPSIFRGERWCSDRCRKAIEADEGSAALPEMEAPPMMEEMDEYRQKAEQKAAEDDKGPVLARRKIKDIPQA